jgi:hypothetical protein
MRDAAHATEHGGLDRRGVGVGPILSAVAKATADCSAVSIAP